MSRSTEETLVIKSTQSSLKLVVSDLRDEYFTATISSPYLTASADVCTFTDSHGLPNLLERLAGHDTAWQGEETWEGIEGNLKLTASCSSLGAVKFTIQLRDFPGEVWQANTELNTEMSELAGIAADARKLFGPSPY